MKRPSLVAASILAGLGLAACEDDPPAPAEVRARISADLAYVLREASAAVEGGAESLPGAAAAGFLDRALGAESEIALRVRSAAARVAARGVRGGVQPADAPYDPSEDIAFLNERVFTDGNHLGDGIYQIPPSLVCAETDFEPDGTPIETIDPECAANLAEAQLRIRVSESGAQLRFALQIGPNHDEPLTISLEPKALSATLDLDDAWRAAGALAKLLGEELPNAELAGQITGRLEIAGPAHAKATLDVERAIAIAFADAGAALDGPDAFRFSSAKAEVLAVELDGNARRGAVALGLGATAAHVPVDDGTVRDRYELDLPGLTARADFGAGQPLELTQVSLGDRTTSLSINGQPATTIDLNPDAGRALGATISIDPATGLETIAVSPKLDLRIAVDHAAWGEPAPVYDVTSVLLEGSVRGDDTGELLEVVTGQLRVTTSPASYGFTAAAGQCVSAREVEDVPSGRFYTEWTVGACP